MSDLNILPSPLALIDEINNINKEKKDLYLLNIKLNKKEENNNSNVSLQIDNLIEYFNLLNFDNINRLIITFNYENLNQDNNNNNNDNYDEIKKILLNKLNKINKIFRKKNFKNYFFIIHGKIITNKNYDYFKNNLLNYNQIITTNSSITKDIHINKIITHSKDYFSPSPSYKVEFYNNNLKFIDDLKINSSITFDNVIKLEENDSNNLNLMFSNTIYLEDLIFFLSYINHDDIQKRLEEIRLSSNSSLSSPSPYLIVSLSYDGIFSNEYLKILRSNQIKEEQEILDAFSYNYLKLKKKLISNLTSSNSSTLTSSTSSPSKPLALLAIEEGNESINEDEFSKIFDYDESNKLMKLYEDVIDKNFNKESLVSSVYSLLIKKYPTLNHIEAERLSNLYTNYLINKKQKKLVSLTFIITFIHLLIYIYYFFLAS